MKKQGVTLKNDRRDTGNMRLWIGFFLPPIAWSIQLESLYLTSYYGCSTSDFRWNHIASVAAIFASVLGGVITWLNRPPNENESAKEEQRPAVRQRFIGTLGLALAVLFTTLIAAQWLPTLTGVPCSK